MIPPNKITIKSDGNILDYVETKKPPKGEVTFIYKYSKSKSKLGELLALNEVDLNKLIKQNT
jgi:hypothetical protein